MTDNQVTPFATFQENIKRKIKDDIGSMIPDDVLQQLTQRAINEAFFHDVPVDEDSYNRKKKATPSWFKKAIAEACEPILKEHIDKWVADNDETVREMVKDAIGEGPAEFVQISIQKMIAQIFDRPFMDMHSSVMNNIEMNLRSRSGY